MKGHSKQKLTECTLGDNQPQICLKFPPRGKIRQNWRETLSFLALSWYRSMPRFHFLLSVLSVVKASANEETFLWKQNCVQDTKNVFGEFQKHILLARRRFCVFNICYVGAQTRKHLGNTKEALILNASRLFPRLCAQATYI